jgi:hypothetical protein
MMTPDITIPFSQVTDKTCAQIIKICLQWVPDAIGWFDYSVSPPMLNIARRGDLAAVTLVAFDGPVSSIEIASRDDLVVPAVVAKYDQNNTVDGVSYACQFVDIYPVHAPDPALRNLVQHIDLIGGNATFTKQPITVTDRPVIPADEDALPWIFRKEPWLNAQASPGVYFYDWGGISIFSITTTLDPKDPQVVNPDPDFPELDTLTEELVSGNVQDWMKENDHVYAAKVLLTIYLSYAGSDATTAALFTFDPANPKTPTAPGQGYFVRYYGITATNAQTQIYQELTSFQESEPVPVGLAQNLYEGLSVLHYEGTIEITESECTGLVGLQNVLNLSGGRAEWTAMVGQVFSITEDIDTGKTSVRIGPNAMMSLEQWTEMLRAARGILFSWKLDQRTTGKVGSPTQVQGAQHSADNTSPTIPATSTSAQLPWSVTLRKVGAAWQAKVFLNSTLYSDNSLGNNIAVTGLDSWFTCVPSSSSPDKIWLKGTVVGLSIDVALSCSGATIQSLGMGSSGFDTTVTTPWASHSFVQNDAADPPNQTIFNVLLATISADAHGNPIVKPNCTANLVLIIQALAGIGAIYPIPATNSAS